MHKYVRLINQQANLLACHSNDMQDQNLLENGHFTLQHTPDNLLRQIEEIVTLVEPAAKNKGIRIHHVPSDRQPDVLLLDWQRFKQVLLNLLNNAVIFTDK